MNENETQSQETEIDSSAGDSAGGDAAGTPDAAAEALVDLDSVEKFKFGGREWSRKDFEGAYMMQSDYTRKTQEIAKERRFYENLPFDLKEVKAHPELIEKFKQVYPKQFHPYLDYVQERKDAAAGKNGQTNPSAMDPALVEDVRAMKTYVQEQERKAIDLQVDTNCERMKTKYPDVPEGFAIAELEAILANKRKSTDNPREQLTPQDYEKAWKAVDDSLGKISKARYTKMVNEQKTANQKGKDVASGGGTPGQAPREARTIRERTELVLQDLQNA